MFIIFVLVLPKITDDDLGHDDIFANTVDAAIFSFGEEMRKQNEILEKTEKNNKEERGNHIDMTDADEYKIFVTGFPRGTTWRTLSKTFRHCGNTLFFIIFCFSITLRLLTREKFYSKYSLNGNVT
jgi:hypothetical protein